MKIGYKLNKTDYGQPAIIIIKGGYDVMENKILDIPEIPSGIIEAAQKGKLVIFIGAGVSRLLGSPGWQSFAVGYIDYLYNNKFINHREKEYLKDLSARKIISICTKIITKNDITLPDHRKILNLDKGYSSEEEYEIYKNLYLCNAIYVTTNYDDYLDKISKNYISGSYFGDEEDSAANNRKVFIRKEELLISNLDNGNILHIHGSVEDEKNMIGSIVDYINHYQENSEIPILLKEIFNNYTVLFVGYGLEEYEILDFIINKASMGEDEIRHYMLLPMFKEQENLLRLQESYYNELGIELRPYNISDNGYDQLIEVVKNWSKIIKKESKSQTFLDKIKIIDEVI